MREPAPDVAIELMAFLRDFVGVQATHEHFELFSAGGVDSMQFLDIVTFVETRFQVTLPPQALTVQELATPARIRALVESLRGG